MILNTQISRPRIIIFLIFVLSLLLRLYGLNWDQGQHLHPDERFLTMVTTDIKLPQNIFQYFDTAASPLNPANNPNYQFFVYGTFPIFLTKLIAVIFRLDSYDTVHFVGRVLSAVFDSLTIFCLYSLAQKIKLKHVFLPSFLYTFTVLPLQLSHFFALDTFLTFFILLTFTLLVYDKFILASIAFGLALTCKISAIYFAPIIVLFLIFYFLQTRNIFLVLRLSFIVLLISFIVYRIFQPYAFTSFFVPDPHFLANLKTLQSFSDPQGWFPPAVQWFSKTKLLFPLQNILFWGLGLPLSTVCLIQLIRFFRKPRLVFGTVFLVISWIILLILVQGFQLAHSMRYFLPIYPFIILLASLGKPPRLLIIFHCFLGLMFLSIYSRPHSRVQASDWIYRHLPTGSQTTNEYWDDPLPLPLPAHDPGRYQSTMLPLYDPDTTDKWQRLAPIIAQTDYIIMSSNRLWGSIPRLPDRYPTTSKFYQDLFDDKLNFRKLIEINSYPGISFPLLKFCVYFGPTNFPGQNNSWLTVDNQCFYPGVYLRDDTAEEAFTVYDHPKVIIFKNNESI